MILPMWRRKPDAHFVEFNHQEERINKLEVALFKQRELNKAILAYVEADISATWMSSAKDLAVALRQAIKD
jgi:hypothetical protein